MSATGIRKAIIEGFRDRLRATKPVERTSTRRDGSERSVIGDMGERVVMSQLSDIIDRNGAQELIRVGYPPGHDERGKWPAIRNSREGDLLIEVRGYDGWERLRMLEVKTSATHPNASITWGELENSEADYLVCVCAETQEVWACLMDVARPKARRMEGADGPYYVVFKRDVDLVPLTKLLDRVPLWPQLHNCEEMPF